MKVEFDKISQGCDYCINHPSKCPGCERNPGLLQLKDHFKKKPKEPLKPPPSPKVGDESRAIPEANMKILREFGIHIPESPADKK